jgi:predicted ATP-grasp superfamily ATP-dependent carboligase
VSPPPSLTPALAMELGALIRFSMGEAAHYGTSVDKTLLPPAAEALGVRVPPYAIVATTDEVERFAGIHGYPLVLKRRRSSSGSGVAICPDRSAIEPAMIELSAVTAEDLNETGAGRLVVQAHISGPIRFYPTMAWRGTVLTGYAGQKLMSNPGPKSPPTVNRYYRSPELRAISTRLAAGFQISGFFSPEFVEDARSGLPYLMEINRRLVGGAHRGSAINVDHCAALHAALHGMPSPTRADLDEGEEHFTIHFPQEWLRDPGSSWLRDYPVDVPWDEPELIEAMLALRHE